MDWDYGDIRDHAVANFSEKAFFRQVDRVMTTLPGGFALAS
jgi:hypothetical protein